MDINGITDDGAKFTLQLIRAAKGHSKVLLSGKQHGLGKSTRQNINK